MDKSTTNCNNKSDDNIENDRPNDDVDCFPWQDKQPVLQQDIFLTVLKATDALPSSIESTTDTPTTPMNTNNNNNDLPNDVNNEDDCPQWKKEQEHKSTQASFHDGVPILVFVWDGTQYQLDYNQNHRPISVWDGTTHTDIVYDNDDDDDDDTNNYAYDYDKYGTVYDYTYGDSFNMNDPSVRSQF